LRDSFELIKNAGVGKIKEIRITGGGAKSALWRQILADVFDIELATVSSVEGSAFGAALLAAVGTGAFPNVQTACEKAIQVTGVTKPSANSAIYNELYPIYRDLYPSLSTQFNRLAKFSQTK
jgi:xylulokinase